MQSIEFPSGHPVTDGAFSPPVRSSYNVSSSNSLKRKPSVLESRATHAGPAKRQQTLTAFHPVTKSGSHQHHTTSKEPLDVRLQKARIANRIHSSGVGPSGATTTNGNRSEIQRQDEARRKAAVAAQERQRAATHKEQLAAQRLASDSGKRAADKQRLNDNRAEQDAWNDRASVMAHTASRPTVHVSRPSAAADVQRVEKRRAEQNASTDRTSAARTSTSRPPGHFSLPSAAPARPRPTAPTRPFPKANTKKQPPSILGQIGADAKRAREWNERQEREVKARKEQLQAASDDITDSQAQQEAEANRAISIPPPYQPLQKLNTIPETNHAPIERPYRSLQTNSTIPEANADAKPQADPDDELVLDPSPPPQGPFSLNSAAGLRALQTFIPRPPPINLPFDTATPAQSTTQRFMGSPSTRTPFKKASKTNKDLLPITISDLKLYQWRAGNISWPNVRELYSEFTGITPLRSEDSLRTRVRQVSKAIEIEEISQELCQQVIDGDEEAAAELNRIAHAGLQASAANPAGLETVPFRKIVKQTPGPRGVTVPPPPAPAALRPMQGGKTLDHDTYMELLTTTVNAHATDDDDDDDEDHREGSPLAEQDFVHWEYYMTRRDRYSEDTDNDDDDDEDQWLEYDASFGHVGQANAEASQFILTTPDGEPTIFKPEEEWQLTFQPLENCMTLWSLKTAHGLAQVQVCRRLWTHQDHVMPETKVGWLGKTLYSVYVRRTQRREVKKMVKKKKITKAAAATTDEDDLSGEQQEDEEEEEQTCFETDSNLQQANDAVYSCLHQVNQEAIEEWLKLTVRPSSANLSEFACKRQEARQELQRELEDAGDGVFFRKVMEDGENTVEVFARKLNMKGPRN